MHIQILGDVKSRGTVDVSEQKSIFDILQEDGHGMAGDQKLQLAQVGGALGQLVWGNDLKKPLTHFTMTSPTILFLGEKFCPVDFGKFMANYIKRELLIADPEAEKLGALLEELSSGKVREYTMMEWEREIQKPAKSDYLASLRENLRYLYSRFSAVFQEHFASQKCTAGICHRLFPAQCINACPAGINIPGYMALMYAGQDELAYGLMRQQNPLSFVCGKICARPCEQHCRRGEIEHTVGVRALKHYAATKALQSGLTEDCLPKNGKQISIIGSGPSGLSAAYFLAKAGYQVDIFEKNPVAGGMLAVGIPSYRLSQESIDLEVDSIAKLGVSIHLNCEIGKDIAFETLQNDYDSILLATGCQVANVFGNHLTNLQSALSFLRQVKLHHSKAVGQQVIVVGGGDVAMDAARTAIRLGAESVNVVSLETYLQMPANDEEKTEAVAEGVILHNGYGVLKITEENQRATQITFQKCTALYDLENNFSPVYDSKDTFTLDCDHIILAIGQKSDTTFLGGAIETDEAGRILFDQDFKTSMDGVFVSGDLCRPGSAIKAIAEGHSAAISMDRHLCNTGMYQEQPIPIPDRQILYHIWDNQPEQEPVALYTQETHCPFAENRQPFSPEQAKQEAFRCMRCDRNSRQ